MGLLELSKSICIMIVLLQLHFVLSFQVFCFNSTSLPKIIKSIILILSHEESLNECFLAQPILSQ